MPIKEVITHKVEGGWVEVILESEEEDTQQLARITTKRIDSNGTIHRCIHDIDSTQPMLFLGDIPFMKTLFSGTPSVAYDVESEQYAIGFNPSVRFRADHTYTDHRIEVASTLERVVPKEVAELKRAMERIRELEAEVASLKTAISKKRGRDVEPASGLGSRIDEQTAGALGPL